MESLFFAYINSNNSTQIEKIRQECLDLASKGAFNFDDCDDILTLSHESPRALNEAIHLILSKQTVLSSLTVSDIYCKPMETITKAAANIEGTFSNGKIYIALSIEPLGELTSIQKYELINSTGEPFPGEHFESWEAALHCTLNEAPLTDSPLTNVKINLTHFKVTDPKSKLNRHDYFSACRQLLRKALREAGIQLAEPIIRVNLKLQSIFISTVYQVASTSRAIVLEEEDLTEDVTKLILEVPAFSMNSFEQQLAIYTDHYNLSAELMEHRVSGDPFEEGSYAEDLVKSERRQKRLPGDLPNL